MSDFAPGDLVEYHPRWRQTKDQPPERAWVRRVLDKQVELSFPYGLFPARVRLVSKDSVRRLSR